MLGKKSKGPFTIDVNQEGGGGLQKLTKVDLKMRGGGGGGGLLLTSTEEKIVCI